MKILLSSSKRHFDPKLTPAETEFWGSSANILARTLYAALTSIGEVTYVDAFTPPDLGGQRFDVFVGIQSRFCEWLELSGASRSVYFAVDMHPRTRNRLLKQALRRFELPAAALASWDLVDADTTELALRRASAVLAVGNIATYNSYVAGGVPKTKVRVLNFGVGEVRPRPLSESPGGVRRFVHVASELGLRKGFDTLERLVRTAAAADRQFQLDLVGLPSNGFYEQKLSRLCADLPHRVTWHGWLDVEALRFGAILEQADFLLFPSVEEGQAGSVLDCMRRGVVPLVSRNSGIDHAPLGWLDASAPAGEQQAIFDVALSLPEGELERLRGKSLEYYRVCHESFEETLRDSVVAAVRGTIYPKVSVTLAIFNKEKTILDLLRRFDRAAKAYGNVELHVIFDGCVDRSEALVRAHYAKQRSFEVSFEVTPNIFEVRSNNLGLRKSKGKYCVLLQDDNMIENANVFFEAVTFLEKLPKAAVLGGLAGVNYYPRGTVGLSGAGIIAMNPNEVYWRQDAATDARYRDRVYEVDACMRGPLFIRKSFLEQHGYLDEVYAPLYQDDMDIAFRAKSLGYRVFCILLDVRNESLTIAHYDSQRLKFFEQVMKRNTDIFYDRWTPTTDKDYMWLERTRIAASATELAMDELLRATAKLRRTGAKLRGGLRRVARLPRGVARRLKCLLRAAR